MKREIKFRAWVRPGKMQYNIVPFTWDFCIDKMFFKCIKSNGEDVLGSNGSEASWEINGFRYNNKSEDCLMEYTGLKDKNGKDVYEGDIDSFGWIVCFESGVFCVKQSLEAKTFVPIHETEIKKVIGNIYENPDLLTA